MSINYYRNQRYPPSVKDMTINGSLLNASSLHFSPIQCFHGIQIDTHAISISENYFILSAMANSSM